MELLRIHVDITDTFTVENENTKIHMILFTGSCHSKIFQGKILPGGVDTQKIKSDDTGTLSARYILEGKDEKENLCHLFIENNATIQDGVISTTQPVIYTDSPCLKWLEKEVLYGEVLTEDGQLIITICKD